MFSNCRGLPFPSKNATYSPMHTHLVCLRHCHYVCILHYSRAYFKEFLELHNTSPFPLPLFPFSFSPFPFPFPFPLFPPLRALPSLPPLPLLLFSLLFSLRSRPHIAARWSGPGSAEAPQRVRAEPGRQTLFGAISAF